MRRSSLRILGPLKTPIRCELPQSFSVSPILFLLFLAPLFFQRKRPLDTWTIKICFESCVLRQLVRNFSRAPFSKITWGIKDGIRFYPDKRSYRASIANSGHYWDPRNSGNIWKDHHTKWRDPLARRHPRPKTSFSLHLCGWLCPLQPLDKSCMKDLQGMLWHEAVFSEPTKPAPLLAAYGAGTRILATSWNQDLIHRVQNVMYSVARVVLSI